MKRSEADASNCCFLWCLLRFDRTKWASGAGRGPTIHSFLGEHNSRSVQGQAWMQGGVLCIFHGHLVHRGQPSQGALVAEITPHWQLHAMTLIINVCRLRSTGGMHFSHADSRLEDTQGLGTTCTSRRFAVDYASPIGWQRPITGGLRSCVEMRRPPWLQFRSLSLIVLKWKAVMILLAPF
jgi:hypothetical protein